MFHVSRNGTQYGPYTADAVRSYLANGSLFPGDLACEDGTSTWRPLSELFPTAPPPVVAPVSPPPPPARVATPSRRKGWILPLTVAVVLIATLSAACFFLLAPQPPVLLMEGSTTIGDALAPALLKDFLRSEGATNIEEVRSTDSSNPHHNIRAKLLGSWRPVTYSIVANGSGNAFKALAANRAEIGMASRPVNDAEFSSLISRGDLRAPASESIVALDGLAVVVNSSNPVNELTRQQVAAIFAGKITDWSEVGGLSGPIHLFGRDSTSGTFDTFVALVFAGNKKGFAPSVRALDNGDAIAAAVASDSSAIGYVGLAQAGSTKALALSDGPGTTALLPSPFTVATEDYILSRRLFLYSLPGHSDFAARFIAYALGPEGQKVVERVGFVKQTPALELADVPASAPLAYRREVDGLRRMSLNFRFKPNSFQLDNKALADLPRALSALAQEASHGTVEVLGFADNRPSAGQSNQYLSEQRAKVVADRLRAYGVQVRNLGFSSAMPVGDNNTPDGREKNRRVELWAR